MSSPDKSLITANLRVGELLEAFPELESVLVALAPPFRKLKNPILRATVAKVVTLRKAASVSGVPLGELIQKLRAAAGQTALDADAAADSASGPAGAASELPEWARGGVLCEVFDADAMLETGEHPLAAIRQRVATLGPGEMIALDSSFRPEPLIDTLTRQGCRVHTAQLGPQQLRTLVAGPPR
jgi:hypothetical protein